MYIKSCYGKFFGTNINIMLCKIMLWVYHVRQGLAVHILSMSTIWIYIMYYYEVYVMIGGPILKSIPDSAWELYFAQYFGMTLHSSEIFPTTLDCLIAVQVK